MTRFELLKTWRSGRPALAVASIVFFLVLMLVGFYTYAQTETGGDAEFRYTFENRSYFNGLTFSLYAFYFGFLLILPIFLIMECAAHIAGETHSGTLYLLLTRPLSRVKLFAVKLGLTAMSAAGLTAGLLGLSLTVGLIAVGWGDLDVYPGVLQMTASHQHLERDVALLRFLLAIPFATVALMAVAGLGLLVSTWVRSPVSAAGTAVALYLVMYVVSEIHFFKDLRPVLFTSYLPFWRGLFQESVDWSALFRDAARLAGFAALFVSAALFRLRTREER